MKRLTAAFFTVMMPLLALAQGWPANYGGVMLQGFYWDSYKDTKWTNLESQADELSEYFDLIWVPQSGWCNSTTSMGYNDIYWYDQKSAFGTEDELKSMIKTFKDKGTGIIADVVINHRGGDTRWTDFPTETNPLDGKTYSMGLSDICSTDEYNTDASAANERNTYGTATGAKDTGDDFNGCRDLDHTSANVQENCKAYTKYLLDYLGYTGFRYDMVKGYSAKYVGMYNAYSNPTYSVGECWDGISTIKTWIAGTKTDGAIQSGAFDFPAKYLMTNNPSDYSKWYNASGALAFDDTYKQYGITFVDNHDTYRTTYGEGNTYKGNTLAANAWILAIPGTPCVFLPHWQAFKNHIGAMIKVRKAVGITNTSSISKKLAEKDCLVAEVEGSNGKLLVIIGDETKAADILASDYKDYKKVLGSSSYAYYTNVDMEPITIEKTADKITVYVNCDEWKDDLYFYAWDSSNNQLLGSWPGTKATQSTTINGETWYYQDFDVPSDDFVVNFIFSKNGSPQTIDIGNITSDKYFKLGDLDGSKYGYKDVTSEYATGISSISADAAAGNSPIRVYSVNGILVRSLPSGTSVSEATSGLSKGLYIVNGKKVFRY